MTTKNIVPRANGEGGLGTAAKHWGSAYIDDVHTTFTFPKELHAGQAVIPDDNADAWATAPEQSNGVAYIYINLSKSPGGERAQWNFEIPRTWTGAAIRATINALNNSAEAGNVVYELFGKRCADGEQFNMTPLTLGTITDTFTAATLRRESPALNLTITGAGNHAVIELQRKYGDGGDTLNESVRVLGINLEIPCTLNP
jgi:hypothetical protein